MDKRIGWSTFHTKDVNDDERIVTGIASTPKTDRVGDIVVPTGAKYKLPIPLLSQHDHQSPIGHVLSVDISDKGIEIEAQIVKDSGLGYVEKAWKQIKSGLIGGLSIGFSALDAKWSDDTDGMIFKTWEWLELSAVTIPANVDCNIQTVKNYSGYDKSVQSDTESYQAVKQQAAAALRQSLYVIHGKKTGTDQ